MKILLLLLASLAVYQTDTSLDCYYGQDIILEKDCSGSSNMLVEALECLVNEPGGRFVALAQQYLSPLKECLERFESCIYLGYTNFYSCTCELVYLTWFKPLNMKRNECKDVPPLNNAREIEIKRLVDNYNKLVFEIKSGQCSSFAQRKRILSENSTWPIKSIESRSSETFKVCTCSTNRCNEPKVGPVETSNYTIIPNGGGNGQGDGSNQPNGDGNGQGAGSNNDKKTTIAKSSAMTHSFEPTFVIMLRIAITISLIFDWYL